MKSKLLIVAIILIVLLVALAVYAGSSNQPQADEVQLDQGITTDDTPLSFPTDTPLDYNYSTNQ